MLRNELIPRLNSDGVFTQLNPQGEFVGRAVQRSEAEANHGNIPVARVFLFRDTSEGRMVLVQKRGATKSLWPGRLEASAVETVQLNRDNPLEPEHPRNAALRGLAEELGVSNVIFNGPPTHERYYGATMTSHITTYTAEYGGDLAPDQVEVANTTWMRTDRLRRMIEDNPEMFTPAFVEYASMNPGKFS